MIDFPGTKMAQDQDLLLISELYRRQRTQKRVEINGVLFQSNVDSTFMNT